MEFHRTFHVPTLFSLSFFLHVSVKLLSPHCLDGALALATDDISKPWRPLSKLGIDILISSSKYCAELGRLLVPLSRLGWVLPFPLFRRKTIFQPSPYFELPSLSHFSPPLCLNLLALPISRPLCLPPLRYCLLFLHPSSSHLATAFSSLLLLSASLSSFPRTGFRYMCKP